MRSVTHPIRAVVPITLCRTVEDPVYELLRDYKNHPMPARSRAAARQTAILAAIIDRFYRAHTLCMHKLIGSDFDAVAVVPSTQSPPVPLIHPLVSVVNQVESFRGMRPIMMGRGPGTIARRESADDAFTVNPPGSVAGKTVLLVDDILASGAHIQSAASTLRLAGASSVVALVVGRIIDIKFNESKRRIWDQADGPPFDFDRCCIHNAHQDGGG